MTPLPRFAPHDLRSLAPVTCRVLFPFRPKACSPRTVNCLSEVRFADLPEVVAVHSKRGGQREQLGTAE